MRNAALPKLTKQVVAVATATTRRSFGSGGGTRGARGHGWWVNYRAGKGGRHLQGEYSHLDVDALHSWNNAVLSLGSQKVYMDILVEPLHQQKLEQSEAVDEPKESQKQQAHRLHLELASEVLPRATENFIQLLCSDEDGYASTNLHRVEKSVGLLGGNVYGDTGRCAEKFRMPTSPTSMEQTEQMVLSHVPGVITMLSQRVNEIDSRFLLCTHHAPHMDGRALAIGRLDTESMKKVQEWESSLITRYGIPTSVCLRIVDCGVFDEDGEETA